MQRASSNQPSGVRRKGGQPSNTSNDASAASEDGRQSGDSRQPTQIGSRKRVRFAGKEDDRHRRFGHSLAPSSSSLSPHARAQDGSSATDLAHASSNPLRSSLVSPSASSLTPESQRRKYTNCLPEAGLAAQPSHLSLNTHTGAVLSSSFHPSSPDSDPHSKPHSSVSEASCDPLSDALPHLSSPQARPSPSSSGFSPLAGADIGPSSFVERGGWNGERRGESVRGSGEAGLSLSTRDQGGGEGESGAQTLSDNADAGEALGAAAGADTAFGAGVPGDADGTASMTGGVGMSLGRAIRIQRLNLEPLVVQRIQNSLDRRAGLIGGGLGAPVAQPASGQGISFGDGGGAAAAVAPAPAPGGMGASTSRSQSFDDTLMREVDDLVALMPQMRLERSRSEVEILMKRRQLLGTYLGTPKSGTGTSPQLPRTHSF